MLGLQAYKNAKLREIIQLRRSDATELSQLQRAQEELQRARISDAELRNLRADREALARMCAEIDTLKRKADAKTALPPAPKPEPIAIDASRNAGRESPAALLATTLWAAADGNLDALADALALEGNARLKAERLFADAPEGFRTMTGSPEKLVAWFTKGGLPAGTTLRLRDEKRGDGNTATLSVVLAFDTDGNKRNAARQLRAQRDGEQWRLVVPESALDQYAVTMAKQAAK